MISVYKDIYVVYEVESLFKILVFVIASLKFSVF